MAVSAGCAAGAAPAGAGAHVEETLCRHCGAAVLPGTPFCCSGCEAAYAIVRGLGLEAYYRRRTIDPTQRPLRPEIDAPPVVYDAFVDETGAGVASITLIVEGLHCAACVWLIESVLTRQPGIVDARINMTTRRMRVRWRVGETTPEQFVGAVERLGYRLVPWDPACLAQSGEREEKTLLRALAVAGFATGNVMLLSVSIWAGASEGMGPATRTFLHWMSALVALPAIAYAGRPFFTAAWAALRARGVTMDVPISLGVLLAAAMSLHETAVGAEHAYFDAAVSLLFFLLIGRYLDRRARGRARSAATHLLSLAASAVTILEEDGARRVLPPARVRPGMRVLVAAGERIAVDGHVIAGESTLDTSLIDGESMPKPVGPGAQVFAGTLNQAAPLTLAVVAVGESTLLSAIAREVEVAEQQRGRYIVLADRIARLYAPVVHAAAAATFLLWWGGLGAAWQAALMNAIAVLIITCPCALGLAVPAVQVVASGRLLRAGILLKSPTALERLAEVDQVVFDKTGTLTEGRPVLIADGGHDRATLAEAAGLAAASRHPLARALVRAHEQSGRAVTVAGGVCEVAGRGLERVTAEGHVRLGSRAFCGLTAQTDAPAEPIGDARAELWLVRPGRAPVRFAFVDPLRADAAEVIAGLRQRGARVALLSGDRREAVAAMAERVGIADWAAALKPDEKVARLSAMASSGQRTLMVGDGLNDAPALAAAHASMSPSSAIDISQMAADLVFQGAKLAPVAHALAVARRARTLVKQNLVLSFVYNALAVPLAMAGYVTPLLAAVFMSTSSILVIINALRLNRVRELSGGR
ncbi:MAG: heavy metal translocating P-type ATPase metal-binding domain-containing protein [Rhodospirillales bacterium]|nr:heavy metal translocating P-type ATPase metal-binding domain-containing protein [Rhodospirillales bacterium]